MVLSFKSLYINAMFLYCDVVLTTIFHSLGSFGSPENSLVKQFLIESLNSKFKDAHSPRRIKSINLIS